MGSGVPGQRPVLHGRSGSVGNHHPATDEVMLSDPCSSKTLPSPPLQPQERYFKGILALGPFSPSCTLACAGLKLAKLRGFAASVLLKRDA